MSKMFDREQANLELNAIIMKILTEELPLLKEKIKKLFENRGKVIKKLKSLGYIYITVDLEGFRSGSMNEVLLK